MKDLLFGIMCLLSTLGFGQNSIQDTYELYTNRYQNGQMSLYQLDAVLSDFFSRLSSDQAVSHYEKVFKRNMYYANDRVYINENGVEDRDVYSRSMLEYLERPICASEDEANWEFHFDPSPSGDFGSHYAGIITAIYMNPSNPEIIVAGAGASGVWFTDSGGAEWRNVTDDLRLPALGINEIIDISKSTEAEGEVLLVATGKEQFSDAYGVGVLKSNDFGQTWTRHEIPLEEDGAMHYLMGITKPAGESDNVYGASYSQVYYSNDRGNTWSFFPEQPPIASNEFYYSIEANGVEDGNIFITTKKKYTTNIGHVWRYNPTPELGEEHWEDLTPGLALALDDEFANITYSNLTIFEEDFGDYTPYTVVYDGVTHELEFEEYDGQYRLRVDPVLTPPVDGETSPGIYTAQKSMWNFNIYEDYPNNGYTEIKFKGDIPTGASIDVWFDTQPIYEFTEADEVDGSDGEYEKIFLDLADISPFDEELNGQIRVFFRFEEGVYDTDAALPILIDDLSFNLIREGSIDPNGFGVSNTFGDEFYVVAGGTFSSDAGSEEKIFFLHTADKGDTWTRKGTMNKSLAVRRLAMAAGYGEEKGLYYGTRDFHYYNFDTESFTIVGTKHDDVRSIQIVENIGGQNRVIVGDDGGVSFSVNGGHNWLSRNGSHLPITQFYGFGIHKFDHKTIVGGTQDNSSFIGAHPSWSLIGSGDGGYSDFSPSIDHPNWYFIQKNQTLEVLDLGGGSVYTYESTDDYPNSMNWFTGQPIEFDPVEGKTIFSGYEKAGGYQATIIRHDIDYDPDGDDIEDDFLIYDFGGVSKKIGAIEIAKANTDWIYAAEGSNLDGVDYKKLYLSTNYGESFIDLSANATALYSNAGLPLDVTGTSFKDVIRNKNINVIETHPDYEEILWIGLSGLNIIDGELVEGEFRILVSENVGATWQDYSAGLPPFPVNDIIYQEGTNDRLFAATDAGVFYRDASMDEWVCFQKGMPATFTTDLEIDYCTQALYAGTYGRGIWMSPIDLPDTEPTEIIENTTWTDVVQDHDVIVKSGNTLTVTGTLEMAGTKHIIVEPGARLKVNGGTITNSCGAFWGGIEVHGNSSREQTPANQGVLTLLNGATIEHAQVAAALWEPGNWAATGGILYASSSAFLNNRKDVEFVNYQNFNTITSEPTGNVSYLTNMTLSWDDGFRTDFPLGHVTMYKVDGVRFTACTFSDDRTDPVSRYFMDFGKTNCGIRSIDAQYFVLPSCSDVGGCEGSLEDDDDWIPTTFTNLDFGIYASTASTERNVSIDRALFTNNLYGVQVVDVNNPNITRNIFDYTDINNNFELNTEYGIHLVRSNGISVQENKFINTSAVGTITGIVSSDLGETEEQIYKNHFKNLDDANITQGKNRLFDPTFENDGKEGEQFLCNRNENNYRDHLVLNNLWGGLPLSSYGVRYQNGAMDEPSGTTFSESISDYEGEDYEHMTFNPLRYFYYAGDPLQIPEDVLGVFSATPVEIPNSCPTKLQENPYQELDDDSLSRLQSDFTRYSTDLANEKAILESLVDGGNTASLIAEIDNPIVGHRDLLREYLLSLSPYVSSEAVKATINNPTIKYPHTWTSELIKANIEVAYEPGFINFLATKSDPLPQQMIDDIQQQIERNEYTDMLVKQSEIALLSSRRAQVANKIILAFKNDMESIQIDSVRHWIDKKADVLVNTRIVDTYLQEGDYQTAQAVVNSIKAESRDYPDHLQGELTDFVRFKNKVITLLSANGHLGDLSEVDHLFMTEMALNGKGLGQYQAQELLCFFYNECAEYPVVFVEGGREVTTTPQKAFSKSEETERQFQIYPNPASNWVTIVLPESDEQLMIRITDLTGRIVTSHVSYKTVYNCDTSNLSNGNYLVTVSNLKNTKQLGTQKLIIQH